MNQSVDYMDKKISGKEWVLVILAILTFGAAIFGVFKFPKIIVVELIALQAAFSVMFVLIGSGEKDEKKDDTSDEYRELSLSLLETKKELEEVRNSKASLTTVISDLTFEKDQLAKKLEAAQNTRAAEKKQVVVTHNRLFDEKYLDSENEIDLIKMTEETIAEMRPYADKAGVSIKSLSTSEKIVFKANFNLMKIMMKNIVDNSIKYMLRPGHVQITLSDTGEDIFIILKDDGNGISENELPHIFDINFQGSNRVSGNGLGLTQAKDIVSAYYGEIFAKSTPGGGMGIYIQLPKTDRKKYEESMLVLDSGREVN